MKSLQEILTIADEATYCFEDKKVDACLAMLDDIYIGLDCETTKFDPFGMIEKLDGKYVSKAFTRLVTLETNDCCVIFDLKFLSQESIQKLADFLTDPDHILVIQNAKFDLKWMLVHLPVKKFNRIYDTMLASQLISCGKVSFGHSLKNLTQKYWDYEMDKEMGASDWTLNALSDKQIIYAARDAAFMRPIREYQIKELNDLGLNEVAKIEFRAAEPYAYAELCGIKLNANRWGRNAVRNKWRAIRMEGKVSKALQTHASTGMLFDEIPTFKVSSPIQLRRAMVAAGIKLPTMLKKGEEKETIQAEYLEKIKDEHPALPVIIKYAHLKKAHTSYGQSWIDKINPVTGRIHPDIFQIGTGTGRNAFREPNLQQIPVENVFRNCFIPEPGNKLISGDYNAAELRIIAEESQDQAMISAYNSDKDLHSFTASVVFRVPYDKLMSELKTNSEYKIYRVRAKNLNFGIVYGIGAKRFAKNADISEEEAYQIIDDYFRLYEGLKTWLDKQKRSAIINKYSVSMAGRRINHNVRYNDDRKIISAVERLGCNFPIQAANADITKIAVRNIYDELHTRVKIVNIIHDEIVIECKAEEAEEIKPIFDSCMIRAGEVYIKSVPVLVESEILDRWSK